MPIYKIQAGRIITVNSYDWAGDKGTIWYDETLGDLRLGDGVTPGGRLLQFNGSGSGTGSAFKTWTVDGQQNLEAVGEDTVKFVAGPGIVLTTDSSATTQTLTVSLDTSNITVNKIADIPVVITTATNGDGLVYQDGLWINFPTMYWASRNW